MKRIGIIGGMGPQATIDLYQKMINHTPADKDQDHIPVIIDSYPQIEDRTACILGQGADPTAKLCESAQRLEQAGALALVMACNTAHYFAPAIRASVSVPLLHIAEETVADIQRRFPAGARIAVLATDGTLKAGIYQHPLQAQGFQVSQLSGAQQERLMDCIYQGAKRNRLVDYRQILQELIDGLQVDGVLLACTELPLFIPLLTTEKALIDPSDILARRAVKFAHDEK